jgi:hypothetical protein
MNDMNDLERLISAARPAGPGDDLNRRIRETLAGSERPSLRSPETRSRRNLLFAVAASALIAAGIGFLAGRATAASGDSPRPSEVALHSGEGTSEDARPGQEPHRTTVPLPPERLAGFFVHAGPREGILGVGPVTVEITEAR